MTITIIRLLRLFFFGNNRLLRLPQTFSGQKLYSINLYLILLTSLRVVHLKMYSLSPPYSLFKKTKKRWLVREKDKW